MFDIIGLNIHCLVFVLFGVFHFCQNISPFHQTFALGTDNSKFQPGILHNPGARLGYEEFLPDLNKKDDIVFITKASMTFQYILKNEKLSKLFYYSMEAEFNWRGCQIQPGGEEVARSNPGSSQVPRSNQGGCQIQLEVARSNWRLPDPTGGCQIQPEVARSNWRLPDPTRGCQIQPEVARSNQRLPDPTGGCQIQPEVARSNWRLPDPTGGCQIQPEVARSNLPDPTEEVWSWKISNHQKLVPTFPWINWWWLNEIVDMRLWKCPCGSDWMGDPKWKCCWGLVVYLMLLGSNCPNPWLLYCWRKWMLRWWWQWSSDVAWTNILFLFLAVMHIYLRGILICI